MFQAQQYVEAMERPAFVDLTGRKFEGRLLSHREMTEHFRNLEAAVVEARVNPSLTPEVSNVLLDAAKRMFDQEAIEALLDMPTKMIEAALADFFESHRPTRPATPSETPEPTGSA